MQQTERSDSAAEWLREFERLHGRPLRVLHLGNIANNGYINAKIQRFAGIEADACCYDYFHAMGCPEWEDADFEGDVGDLFFPDWWAVDLHGFRRPSWFVQGPLRTCQRYLLARSRGDGHFQRLLGRQLRLELWLRCRSTWRAATIAAMLGVPRPAFTQRPSSPPGRSDSQGETFLEWLARLAIWACRSLGWLTWRVRSVGWDWLRRLAAYVALVGRKLHAASRASAALAAGRGWRTAALTIFPRKLAALAHTKEQHQLVDAARLMSTAQAASLAALYKQASGSADGFSEDDYRPYLSSIPLWRQVFSHYDVIQGYAIDSLLPLLAGTRNYTAYEHGTLRDIPFEESARGRLCALTYRAAPVVFLTNSDVVPSARRLGITDEQLVFLPHAVDSDRLRRFAAEHEGLRPTAGDEVVFVSPTRHDWFDADPLWAKGNDRLIRAFALLRDQGLTCRLVLFEWGRHVEESKRLIDELGLTDRITWSPTLRKRELWARYMSAHAVIDQFLTPAMGSVAFESLALGCRVITALDELTVTQFFDEMPPILNARDPEEIAAALCRVVEDPEDSAGIGPAAMDWFQRRHSTERIVELQLAAYERLLATGRQSVSLPSGK